MKSLMPVKLHEIRWKKFSNAVEKFRWKEASCPLVPVPPHGRLIDADEFTALMFADPYQDFVHILGQMPTIIEAEEGE